MRKIKIVQYKPAADRWESKPDLEWTAGSGSPLYLNKEAAALFIPFLLASCLATVTIVNKDLAPNLIFISVPLVLLSIFVAWYFLFHRVVRLQLQFTESFGTIQIARGLVFQREKSFRFNLPLGTLKYDDDDQELVYAELKHNFFCVIGKRCDLETNPAFDGLIIDQKLADESEPGATA